MGSKIAIVDDDPDWGDLWLVLLKGGGYEAVYYATAGRFFDALAKARPDVVILDMRLPGINGLEAIRILRGNQETRRILIVAVSGHDVQSAHAVKAFEAGADEYLAKPVDQNLLLARLGSLLRRGPGERPGAGERVVLGPLAIMPEERVARLGEREMTLTHLEFDLLLYFARQPDRVLTRGLILETVWGGDPEMNTRTVDKHVESLRRKLGAFGQGIETVIRVGYVFKGSAFQPRRGPSGAPGRPASRFAARGA